MDNSIGKKKEIEENIKVQYNFKYPLILITSIFIIALMMFSTFMGNRIASKYSLLIDASMEIKLETTTAHLWFEEIISGDTSLDIEKIWRHLDRALWYSKVMIEGGENQDGVFIALTDPKLYAEIKKVIKNISKFRNIAEKRYLFRGKENTSIGSEIDQKFDHIFLILISHSNNVEKLLKSIMKNELTKFSTIQYSLIIIVTLLIFTIAFVLHQSEKKRSEVLMQLEKNRNNLAITLNSIGDGVISTDSEGLVVSMNPIAENLTGWYRSEASGHSIEDVFKIINEKTRKKVENPVKKVIKEGIIVGLANHTILISKDGKEYNIDDSGAPIWDEKGDMTGVILVFRDVSEKKKEEKVLELNQRRLEEAQKLAKFGYYVFDINSGSWSCSLELDDIFGIDENFKKDIPGWMDIIHPEFKDDMSTYLQDNVLTRHQEFDKEYKIINIKSGEEKWVHGLGHLKFDENKDPIEMFGAIQDITERKKMEYDRNKLHEQLVQAQKMEAIGTLAGGIAHDFNNILGVIMGFTELTLDDLTDKKVVASNLKRVMQASVRAKEMVYQILAFSRKDEQTMRSVNIGNVIMEVITFLRSTIPTTIEIKKNIEKDIGMIFGNITQINQVLMNLSTNAAHAMKEEGGKLEIGLKEIAFDKDSSVIIDLKPGKYQQLTVSDTGIGMSKEILERIFEPYYTTKGVDEGTGMGLAVSYGIVKSHRGVIRVYSEPGKGTVFNVYFPVLESEKSEVLDDRKQTLLMGNNENILFVDDEITLVELGAKMLKNLGYQVESRNSSKEALEVFRANPDKFDLVMTDMTMPDMTGIKLAAEIHEIRSDCPIVLCTGFSSGIDNDNYITQGISALIMKPVDKKELAEVIRDIFDKKK